MILSHKHRFIFLKTKKTAGTSVELALSEICGPYDIVTPLIPSDEALRRFGGPRNFRVPPRLRPLGWQARLKVGQDERRAGLVYYNHMTAAQVRKLVDPEVWHTYRKVTIERNPWDREVSYYFWQNKFGEKGNSFERFALEKNGRVPINNFDIYSLSGRPIADIVLRHECLANDFAAFMYDLGIENVPPLPNAKSSFRPDGARDYRRHYTSRAAEAVARRYKREIDYFGYTF
jgi:hypothetical protein